MGNKLGRRRPVVDERYTKPQGLYVHKDVDHKKLRKLILESKLAPCFPGDEETFHEHEECPICFLYYPSLNRSRCCMKGICTECFLQMKNPNSARPTQCPFCKTSNYAVEYRGVKTKEEKGFELIEEQRVIEAKIRMRQQELQDEEERTHNKLEPSSSSTNISQQDIACSSSAAAYHRSPVEIEETVERSFKHPSYSTANREEEFDLDLEDIMVMEAIWLSIQAKDRQRNMGCGEAYVSDQYALEAHYTAPPIPPLAGPSSSPSGGLACAIAALAERQQLTGESSFQNNELTSTNNMGPESSNLYHRMDQDTANYVSAQSACHMLPDCRMTAEARNDGDWCAARGSDGAEAGTSYASSDTTEDCSRFNALLPPPPPPDEINGTFDNISTPIVPETFEEQMMLAMAVSLAEARAMTVIPRSEWQ